MNFTSVNFFIFLIVLFLLYWSWGALNKNNQNIILMIFNLIFYGFWSIYSLIIVTTSCLIDFIIALGFKKYGNNYRKSLLLMSIFVNISSLVFFKYFDFFVIEFNTFTKLIGLNFNLTSLGILIPIGISYLTFQKLSYTIDIYKKRIEPIDNIITYFAYIIYFPTIISGPIERAVNLLPQFNKIREFNYDLKVDGLKQILWGTFKKIVIADTAAIYVNDIFANINNFNGSTLFLGSIIFSFQLYCDFSGYSDIVVGISKLFGIKITNNFAYPYFSRSITEFWRKWHISLLNWIRVYIFMPLGGGFGTKFKIVRNTLVVFVLSGLWHGPKWTFVIWGVLNAIYLLPEIFREKKLKFPRKVALNRYIPSFVEFRKIIITFLLVTLGWIFFRSDSIQSSYFYFSNIFSYSFFNLPLLPSFYLLIFIPLLIIIEWVHRNNEHPLQFIKISNKFLRYGYYYILIILIYYFSYKGSEQFLYFRF